MVDGECEAEKSLARKPVMPGEKVAEHQERAEGVEEERRQQTAKKADTEGAQQIRDTADEGGVGLQVCLRKGFREAQWAGRRPRRW
jgi:hypothetical protein